METDEIDKIDKILEDKFDDQNMMDIPNFPRKSTLRKSTIRKFKLPRY